MHIDFGDGASAATFICTITITIYIEWCNTYICRWAQVYMLNIDTIYVYNMRDIRTKRICAESNMHPI